MARERAFKQRHYHSAKALALLGIRTVAYQQGVDKLAVTDASLAP